MDVQFSEQICVIIILWNFQIWAFMFLPQRIKTEHVIINCIYDTPWEDG